jgi:hypothetical protein
MRCWPINITLISERVSEQVRIETSSRSRHKQALLFEKRSKNFGSLARALAHPKYFMEQVFWFFSAKKRTLCLALLPLINRR